MLYRRWAGVIGRCCRKSHTSYPDYGAKGVTVCERWRSSYEAFKADVGQPPSPAHQLDRIENAKGYEPGNVRWATWLVNMRNRTCTRRITAWGEAKTLTEWVEDPRCRVNYFTLRQRLDVQSLDPEEAISRPSKKARS